MTTRQRTQNYKVGDIVSEVNPSGDTVPSGKITEVYNPPFHGEKGFEASFQKSVACVVEGYAHRLWDWQVKLVSSS